jgi:hypothetical protein
MLSNFTTCVQYKILKPLVNQNQKMTIRFILYSGRSLGFFLKEKFEKKKIILKIEAYCFAIKLVPYQSRKIACMGYLKRF